MKKKIIISILTLAILIFAGDYTYKHLITVEGCSKCRQQGKRSYYSQYLEDYILSIVFEKQEKGFYVDVGAAHPSSGSVTKLFYKKGWRGINFEPIKELYKKLVEARPEDINYNLGISDEEGELNFYQSSGDGGLSGFNIELDNQADSYRVPVTTLSEILTKNNIKEIDFLKIDVEGFERNVLLGLDFKKFSPKVVLLEALDAKSLEPNHQDWENILTNSGYSFILFDGINRFYINNNNPELIDGFKEAYRCIKQINESKRILIKEPFLHGVKL